MLRSRGIGETRPLPHVPPSFVVRESMTNDEPDLCEPPRAEQADLMVAFAAAFRRAGREVSPLLLDWVVELELERRRVVPVVGGGPI
jgi:hypothetical protein